MRSEQPEALVQTCLTCGTRVEVVSTDEGTQHYRPARVEGLSDEDRARLEGWVRQSGYADTLLGQSLTRALALIDHQAKALEAADELARVAAVESANFASGRNPELGAATRAYRSTRTTERTTDG